MLEALSARSTPICQNVANIARPSEKVLLIVSEIRLLREGIAEFVKGHPALRVTALCETIDEALSAIQDNPDATVLLDGSFPQGHQAVRAIHDVSPSALVIAFAVSETEENIVAWAKAGAVGYIPASAALHEFAGFIESVSRGEQICSAAIASRLIRR